MSPFCGATHWYPYFGLLVTSPLGFKAKVGSALFKLSGGVRVRLHIPWDLPLTTVLLAASMAAEPFLPHTCKALVGLEYIFLLAPVTPNISISANTSVNWIQDRSKSVNASLNADSVWTWLKSGNTNRQTDRILYFTVIFSGGSRISLRWGRQLSRGGAKIHFCQNFSKNCMKLKDFGRRGGGTSFMPPLDPPLMSSSTTISS